MCPDFFLTIRNEYDKISSGDTVDTRNANIIIGNAGGTASSEAKTYKISLPTDWIKALGITEADRQVQMTFDGDRIAIERHHGIDDFISSRASMGHDVIKLEYYDKDTLCTLIAIDMTDKSVAAENHVEAAVKTAFGNNKTPDWDDLMLFLEERCIPRTRSGIRHYLDTLGIVEYDPWEIIRKTQGRMAEDEQWLAIYEVRNEDQTGNR